MLSTDVLYRIACAAEEAGNYELARKSYERASALGDADALMAQAYMYDVGLGDVVDKMRAMQLYRRAWRKGCPGAATNIANLYREQGNHRAMFQWFKRQAETGDGGAHLDLAKCYLRGTGVRRCVQMALRCLAVATMSESISEAERDEAQALMETLRPRSI